MTDSKLSPVIKWLRCSALTLSFGLTFAASAAHAQIDEVTGLPAKAVRSVSFRTLDNGRVQFDIVYYQDRITKKELAAAAPGICERLDIKFDRVRFPPDSNEQGDLFSARARIVEVRCR